jgi:hypothetical protein
MKLEINVINEMEFLKEVGLRKEPVSKVSITLDTDEYGSVLIFYQSVKDTVYKKYYKKINDKNKKIYKLVASKKFYDEYPYLNSECVE